MSVKGIHFRGDNSVKMFLVPFEKGSTLQGSTFLGAHSFPVE